MAHRTLGVEEELLLVDPDSGRVVPHGPQTVTGPTDAQATEIEAELYRQQVETSTAPCGSHAELVEQIAIGRRTACERAGRAGARAVAMPVPILEDPKEEVSPNPRYETIRDEYGELARQSLVCAMHVHVAVQDEHEGVVAIDRVRPWLPVLLALSANSPYWLGRDTAHASWRSQIWTRWPTSGPQEPFGDLATYREVAASMQEYGAALDAGMLYFDIRLSDRFSTVEFRIADVCTATDDAVLIALLARALVSSSAADALFAVPARLRRVELLRAAAWQAGKSGTDTRLVDPRSGRASPAREVVDDLVAMVSDALEESGDLPLVRDLVDAHFGRGGGAARQRAVFDTTQDLRAVVLDLADRTEAATR